MGSEKKASCPRSGTGWAEEFQEWRDRALESPLIWAYFLSSGR